MLLIFLIGFALPFALPLVVRHRSSATGSPPPNPAQPTPPPTARYESRLEDLEGDWSPDFVPFSFDYPVSWERDPKAGKSDRQNFVKVERKLVEDGKPFTLENFAVGHFRAEGKDSAEAALPKVARALDAQFAAALPGYRQVSERPVTLAGIRGDDLRFEGKVEGTPKGDLSLWGRVIILPTSADRGISLIMLASSLAPAVTGPADVGEKGELPVILNSFRVIPAPSPGGPPQNTPKPGGSSD